MNREIKFRAWDIGKNVFIPVEYWAVISNSDGATAVMLKDWEDYKEGEYFYPYNSTITQYTGLKDKNGTEIYEGDVVDQRGQQNTFVEYHKTKWVLRYDDDKAEWRQELHNKLPQHLTVVGNIYEHPHLINHPL